MDFFVATGFRVLYLVSVATGFGLGKGFLGSDRIFIVAIENR